MSSENSIDYGFLKLVYKGEENSSGAVSEKYVSVFW